MVNKAPRSLVIFQIVLWTLVAVALVYMLLPRFLAPQPVAISGPVTQLGPGADMLTPFTLVSEEGKPSTEKDFAGKPGLWFYGFANCPDICPTALAEIGILLEQLGPEEAARVNAVFVTVDPERDTVEVLKSYLDYFDPRITGLTGDLAAVSSMAKARFVAFEKIPQGDSYAMQHPAGIFLVDGDGHFAGTLDPEESMEVKLTKVRRLIADSA